MPSGTTDGIFIYSMKKERGSIMETRFFLFENEEIAKQLMTKGIF